MMLWRVHIRGGVFGDDDSAVALVWAGSSDDAEEAVRRAFQGRNSSVRDPKERDTSLRFDQVEPYVSDEANVLVAGRIEPGSEAEKVYR